MATIAGQAAVSPAGLAAKTRSRFFAYASIVIAALILVAFARTYFVSLATGSAKFILLRHVHGAVFFTWLALYGVQSNLAGDVLLLPLALHDRRVLGRVHPVTVAAAAVLLPFNLVEPLIARSGPWSTLAPHLFGFR